MEQVPRRGRRISSHGWSQLPKGRTAVKRRRRGPERRDERCRATERRDKAVEGGEREWLNTASARTCMCAFLCAQSQSICIPGPHGLPPRGAAHPTIDWRTCCFGGIRRKKSCAYEYVQRTSMSMSSPSSLPLRSQIWVGRPAGACGSRAETFSARAWGPDDVAGASPPGTLRHAVSFAGRPMGSRRGVVSTAGRRRPVLGGWRWDPWR